MNREEFSVLIIFICIIAMILLIFTGILLNIVKVS